MINYNLSWSDIAELYLYFVIFIALSLLLACGVALGVAAYEAYQ